MKNFLVVNTSYFGDTILTSGLVRYIKKTYPTSNVIFIANKPFVDVAKYMDGVDEVWSFDKWGEHKGLNGIINFYMLHKGKYVFDASFVIYGNERGILLSKILGCKQIYSDNHNFLFRLLLDNKEINYGEWVHFQDKFTFLFTLYSNLGMESISMKYNVPLWAVEKVKTNFLVSDRKYIAINPTTKSRNRDLKQEEICDFIDRVINNGFSPIIVGAGREAEEWYNQLPQLQKDKLINVINRTSIVELGALLSCCEALVSADTGTAHFALAMNVPLVVIFHVCYDMKLKRWAPKDYYNYRLIAGTDYTGSEIYDNFMELMEQND